MKSEQAVLPNPCLEGEEEEDNILKSSTSANQMDVDFIV
jgi:hypothetical protein